MCWCSTNMNQPSSGFTFWMPFSPSFYGIVGDGSKPWYLVNPKIAGKWMFIPLKCIYRYLWNSFFNISKPHHDSRLIESYWIPGIPGSQLFVSPCRRTLFSFRLRLERLGDDSERRQRPCGPSSSAGGVFGSWVDWGKNPLNFMGKYWNMFNNSYSWWCYVSNFQIGHNYFQLWLGMDKNGNIMGIEWIWLFQPLASGYSHTWTIRIRTMGYSLVMTQPWPFQAWTNGITMTITGI